jgi:hypothetical protein
VDVASLVEDVEHVAADRAGDGHAQDDERQEQAAAH